MREEFFFESISIKSELRLISTDAFLAIQSARILELGSEPNVVTQDILKFLASDVVSTTLL